MDNFKMKVQVILIPLLLCHRLVNSLETPYPTVTCPSPPLCIGAENVITCDFNASLDYKVTWQQNSDDLHLINKTESHDLNSGLSNLTFIGLPSNNNTRFTCLGSANGKTGTESCTFYVNPIPPVPDHSLNITVEQFNKVVTITWDEPSCLPKDYKYLVTIDINNTATSNTVCCKTIKKNTTESSLTISNSFKCTNYNVTVTVIHCGFNDSSTSKPATKFYDYTKRSGKDTGIKLNDSMVKYTDTGNKYCFSLQLQISSEFWLCYGLLFATFNSSVKVDVKWAPKVKISNDNCNKPITQDVFVIGSRVKESEKLEIKIYNYGINNKTSPISFDGGQVNILSCHLLNTRNTALNGTDGCYNKTGFLSTRNSTSGIFNHNRTAVLVVFNVTDHHHHHHHHHPEPSTTTNTTPLLSANGNSTTLQMNFTNTTSGEDDGKPNYLKLLIKVLFSFSLPLVLIVLVVMVLVLIYCIKKRSKEDSKIIKAIRKLVKTGASYTFHSLKNQSTKDKSSEQKNN